MALFIASPVDVLRVIFAAPQPVWRNNYPAVTDLVELDPDRTKRPRANSLLVERPAPGSSTIIRRPFSSRTDVPNA